MSVEELADRRRSGGLSNIDIRLVSSHFGAADNPNFEEGANEDTELRRFHYGGGQHRNDVQLRAMHSLREAFPGVPTSFSNSAGIFLLEQAGLSSLCDHPRAGLALWGGDPARNFPAFRHNPFLPAITLHTTIKKYTTRPQESGEAVVLGTLSATTHDLPILQEMADQNIPLFINGGEVLIDNVNAYSGEVFVNLSDVERQLHTDVTIIGEANRYKIAELLPRIAHYAIVDAVTDGSRDVENVTRTTHSAPEIKALRDHYLQLLREGHKIVPPSADRDRVLPFVQEGFDQCIDDLRVAFEAFEGVPLLDMPEGQQEEDNLLSELLDRSVTNIDKRLRLIALYQKSWERMPAFLPPGMRGIGAKLAVAVIVSANRSAYIPSKTP